MSEEKYKPTGDDIWSAEKMLTDEQWKMSMHRLDDHYKKLGELKAQLKVQDSSFDTSFNIVGSLLNLILVDRKDENKYHKAQIEALDSSLDGLKESAVNVSELKQVVDKMEEELRQVRAYDMRQSPPYM